MNALRRHTGYYISKHEWRVLVTLIISLIVLSSLSSLATRGAAMVWYTQLSKPPFTPPGWSFEVVWPTLYVMMATSAWCVWRKRHTEIVLPTLCIFFVQLSASLIWPYLFFGLRSPTLGFAWIIVLIPLIILTMVKCETHSRIGAKLLIPYLMWTCFALVLSYQIWRLN